MKFGAREGNALYLKAILISLVIQIALMLVNSGIALATGVSEINPTVQIIETMMLQLGFCAAVLSTTRKNIRSLPIKSKFNIKHTIVAVVVGVVCIMSYMFFNEWFTIFLLKTGYKLMDIDFTGVLNIILFSVLVVVLSPIFEEVIFRNGLLGGLINDGKKPIVCILLSGIAFSFMHMNPEQTFYQFMLGCVCAFMVIKSGNFITASIIHATSNVCALLLEYVPALSLKGKNGVSLLLDNIPIAIVATFVLAIVGSLVIFMLGKLVKKTAYKDKESYGDKTGAEYKNTPDIFGKNTANIFYIMGLGICIIMWITVMVTGYTS